MKQPMYPKATDDLILDPLKLGNLGEQMLTHLEGLTEEEATLTFGIALLVYLRDITPDKTKMIEAISDFANHVVFMQDRSSM